MILLPSSSYSKKLLLIKGLSIRQITRLFRHKGAYIEKNDSKLEFINFTLHPFPSTLFLLVLLSTVHSSQI